MKMSEIVEARFSRFDAERSALLEAYSPLIEKADAAYQAKTGTKMSEWSRKNLARMLDNVAMEAKIRGSQSLFETTTGDNVSFLGVDLRVAQ